MRRRCLPRPSPEPQQTMVCIADAVAELTHGESAPARPPRAPTAELEGDS